MSNSLKAAADDVRTLITAGHSVTDFGLYQGPPRVFTNTVMFARLRAALTDAQVALQAAERELLRRVHPDTALAPPPVASGMSEPLAAYLEQQLHSLVMLLFYSMAMAQQQGLPIEAAWDRYVSALQTGDVARRLYHDLVEDHAHRQAPTEHTE